MADEVWTAGEYQEYLRTKEAPEPPAREAGARTIRVIVPILPTAQARARSAVIHGHARTYKAKKQRTAESAIMAYLAPHRPAFPFRGPVELLVRAYLPIPASRPKGWKADAAAGRVRPVTKPDLDNLCKQIKDCLSALCFWDDDRQVVGFVPGTGKYYSEQPRWEIEIRDWVPGVAEEERRA